MSDVFLSSIFSMPAVQPALKKISTAVLGGVSPLTALPEVLKVKFEEFNSEVHTDS